MARHDLNLHGTETLGRGENGESTGTEHAKYNEIVFICYSYEAVHLRVSGWLRPLCGSFGLGFQLPACPVLQGNEF